MARVIAAKFTETWGQPVVIDNRAGGSGNKLYQETRRILLTPELRNRFEATGTFIIANTPHEFAQIIQHDLAKWAVVIKASGAKIE